MTFGSTLGASGSDFAAAGFLVAGSTILGGFRGLGMRWGRADGFLGSMDGLCGGVVRLVGAWLDPRIMKLRAVPVRTGPGVL